MNNNKPVCSAVIGAMHLLLAGISVVLVGLGCATSSSRIDAAQMAARVGDLVANVDEGGDPTYFEQEITSYGKPVVPALIVIMQSTIREIEQCAIHIEVPRGRDVWELKRDDYVVRCSRLAFRYLMLLRAYISIQGSRDASALFERQLFSVRQEVPAALLTASFNLWCCDENDEQRVMSRLLHAHPSPMARKGFVQSIYGKSYAVPMLVKVLADTNETVCVAAGRKLKMSRFTYKSGKPSLTSLVTPVLDSTNLVARVMAEIILCKVDGDLFRAVVTNRLLGAEVRLAALEEVNQTMPAQSNDVDRLRTIVLQEEDAGLKIEALNGLWRHLGEDAVNDIAVAFQDSNEEVQLHAINWLAPPWTSNAVERLRGVVQSSSNSIVVARAAQAIGLYGESEFMIEHVLTALRSERDEYKQAEIIDILSESKSMRVAEILKLMLQGEDIRKRFLAACALGRCYHARDGMSVLLDFSSEYCFEYECRRIEALQSVLTRLDVPLLNVQLSELQKCKDRFRAKQTISDLISLAATR